MGAPKFTWQFTEPEFEALFPTDEACKAYLAQRRWPDGTRCSRCGNAKVYELPHRPFHWQCHSCSERGYRFSVLVGTVFENTKVSLRVWFKVICLMLNSKAAISALQVHRMMDFGSYQTAHYMCHRIRTGLADPQFRQLMGIVEADETYIGGKAKNKHGGRKDGPGRGTVGKLIVAGAVSRKGTVVARVIQNTDSGTLTGFIREAVSTKVDPRATDEHSSYTAPGKDYHTRSSGTAGVNTW